MKVKTTETILDRQKEHKELMLEINKLNSEKEILKREVSELSNSKTILANEIINGLNEDKFKNINLLETRNNLETEITKLTEEKSSLESLLVYKESEVNNLFEESKKIIEEINTNSEKLYTLNLQLEKAKEITKNETLISQSKIEELNKKIEKLEKNREESEEQIKEFEQEYLDKKSWTAKEDIRLAHKGNNLEKYEVRLRRKYLELMPDKEIIV